MITILYYLCTITTNNTMRNYVIELLECIEEDVNWYNEEINTKLKALGCEDEEKFAPSITKDINALKSLVNTLTEDQAKLIKQLIYHCQLSGEINAYNQSQLDVKIKTMAELIADIPVAEIDIN